jgi:iron complex transport system substrate-binding protein
VQDCIADLDGRTKDIPDAEKPTVYYGAVSFRGYNGIDATYAHYNPFEIIHARNVADETDGNGAMTVEKEQVATWDPDILFINQEGPTLGILQEDFKTNPDFYRGLSAVQNGKVYGQAAYNCVYTNIELSLINAYYAATIIYPEQFKDVDFQAKAEEILTMFEGEAGPSFLKMMEDAGLGYHQVTMFD